MSLLKALPSNKLHLLDPLNKHFWGLCPRGGACLARKTAGFLKAPGHTVSFLTFPSVWKVLGYF